MRLESSLSGSPPLHECPHSRVAVKRPPEGCQETRCWLTTPPSQHPHVMIIMDPSPEQEHADKEASDSIAKVSANWPSRKEKGDRCKRAFWADEPPALCKRSEGQVTHTFFDRCHHQCLVCHGALQCPHVLKIRLLSQFQRRISPRHKGAVLRQTHSCRNGIPRSYARERTLLAFVQNPACLRPRLHYKLE